MRRRSPAGETGLTVVELLVTISLLAVLGGLGLTALQRYAWTQEHQGTADEVVSTLRDVAQRSLSEGRTYCVAFDTGADAWTVYRRQCSTSSGTVVDGAVRARGTVRIDSPSFTPADPTAACPAAGTCAYFYPRGTGSPGSVQILRDGSAPITVSVEGLTGHVSTS
jgi:type II secretory pathway pseudopilin PulG